MGDFAIKYVGKENAQHLIRTLESKYQITKDWQATKFCGIDLDWDYKKRTITLSMKHYITNLLHKLQHPLPTKAENNPHIWTPPKYGTKTQYAPILSKLPILPPERI